MCSYWVYRYHRRIEVTPNVGEKGIKERCFLSFPDCPEQRTNGELGCSETCRAFEFNVDKTSFLEKHQLIPDRDRAADSLGPRLDASCYTQRKRLFQYNIGELEPSSWLQDAMYLAEYFFFFRSKVDHTVRNDDIEETVLKGNILGTYFFDLEIPDACTGEVFLCPAYHISGQVYSVDTAAWSYQTARDK
jgi:hypothetical protein